MAGRPKTQSERKGSGSANGSGRIWAPSTGGGGSGGAGGTSRSSNSGRRDSGGSAGSAGSRESRPHSAPGSGMLGTNYGQRRDSDAAREKQAREAAMAAQPDASPGSIEARLGIVKKNRRSSSGAGIPGSGLESVDLTKDDSTESRRRIAEYIGRFGLHRSASDSLSRREGRASTPDGGGRRAKSVPAVEGLQVYDVADGVQTLPARLREGDTQGPRAEGASKAFGSQDALLCPAAVDLPEQLDAALPFIGFVSDHSASETDTLQPLFDALVGESLTDPGGNPNPMSLWSLFK
eukprot:Hpha_TRINITY_DN16165_c3_g3::TRINITY_DN16165_c3_g3_i1::g.9270::m.9270